VLDVVDGEVEITNKEYTIVFLKILTRQEVNMSRNMKDILLNIIRSFKGDVATGMETVNSDVIEKKQ
jgi:hypothetical protein